ncbi:DUF4907 domain-containing protein [Aquimarina hainanensis]|uniref:DUF4907 domain-containing protein n=1 Tax=Aquimarina hainanensis TaxID=1578017 RepID=A0ABW5NCT8_9FLAO|nr:DUF4907 domain-containing protein [Aquimarina sp. TRL1]QKX06607.1 DUF4907 domain-containing protein [Aquimarina sp. TRL1]
MNLIKSIKIINLLVLGMLVGTIVYTVDAVVEDTIEKKEPLITSVHKTMAGYGYTIKLHNRVIIKQDYIPAIQENKSFCTAAHARLVGDFVKEKLLNGISPSVSISELKKITVNCLHLP